MRDFLRFFVISKRAKVESSCVATQHHVVVIEFYYFKGDIACWNAVVLQQAVGGHRLGIVPCSEFVKAQSAAAFVIVEQADECAETVVAQVPQFCKTKLESPVEAVALHC